VGPAGDFVRDEAGRGRSRGVLVPVKLDNVDPPLKFGEVQAIDLTRWNGNPRAPSFVDLVATVAAKLDGRPVPPPRAPMRRLQKRLAIAGFASAFSYAGLGLVFNISGLQDQMCAVSLFQPGLSDMCGALGLGRRPTREERIAWAERPRSDCNALRSHIERFPNGAFRSAAADMLSARRVTQTETWQPGRRQLTLQALSDGAPASTEVTARARALERTQGKAEQLCRGFAATTLFRLKTASIEVRTWQCDRTGAGTVCGFEGEAICELEERRVQERESCES
jgi:hypothetical protein